MEHYHGIESLFSGIGRRFVRWENSCGAGLVSVMKIRSGTGNNLIEMQR